MNILDQPTLLIKQKHNNQYAFLLILECSLFEEMAKHVEVSVRVIQARNLQVEANASTQVEVQIGPKRKRTKVVKFTDSPFFDEYFTFEYKLHLEDVLEKNIKFKVRKKIRMLSWTTIAEFSMPLRAVWQCPYHQIYHKWAPLAHGSNWKAGNQGHLKIDVLVLCAGEQAADPLELNYADDDYVEANLIFENDGLSPPGDRQYANYTVKIFSADGLPKQSTSVIRELRKAVGAHRKNLCSPAINIRISDLDGRTSVLNYTQSPTWNEALVFTDIFPPTWSYVRVQLMNFTTFGAVILAEHCIPTSLISHLSETEVNNFPPTFGPSFVHVYSEDGSYAGRILLSIGTQILDETASFMSRKVKLRSCDPCPEIRSNVELTLFASTLEVNMIDPLRARQNLLLQVCFGSPFAPQGHVASTPSLTPSKGDEDLSSLPVVEEAPCVYIIATWLNRCHSMFVHNRFMKIVAKLEDEINSQVHQTQQTLRQVVDLCTQTLKHLESHKITPEEHTTSLDALRTKLHTTYLKDTMKKCADLMKNGTEQKRLNFMEEVATKLRALAIDPQQFGLPNICVRFLNAESSFLLADHYIQPQSILYSQDPAEIGVDCCQPITVFMQPRNSADEWETVAVAKIRMYLWLCDSTHIPACLDKLNSITQNVEYEDESDMPSLLRFTEKQIFECRAHIYQGNLIPGWDRNGLCDPYIRISIGNRSCCTEVKHESLSPKWEQTLVLWPVFLYGSSSNIISQSPPIVMEVFDLDVGKSPEYVGRIAVHPKIQLHSNQPSKKPRFEWFVIKRGSSAVANILAAFELIRHESEDTILGPVSPALPFTRRYRLECLFWGIRGKIRVWRPCIKLECAGHEISSTVIANAFLHNNFDQPLQWIEIELPENAVYLPPLTVKLYDHRNLCKPHFEGACMIPSLKPYLQLPRRGRAQKTTQISKAEFGTAQSDCIIKIEEKGVHNEDTSEKTPLLSIVKQGLTKKACSSEVTPIDQNVSSKTIQLDWWSKLYASEGNTKHSYKIENPGVSVVKLKIYDRELESIPEFNGFTDLVQQFSIVKGHRCMNEEPPEVAKLKTGFSLVRLMENEDAETLPTLLNPPAVLQPLESRQSVKVLVRLYIVRGRRLKAKDIDGLSDPYIVINTNLGQRISDREHYIKGDLNPIFGRCFELIVTLPGEYQLKISVMDRDETGHDDLIGQTLIDIENRLMSRHRAHCGISARYDSSGYSAWRDGELPSQILKSLCEQHSIPQPKVQGLQMTVGPLTVVGHPEASSEQLALAVLRRWDEVAGWSLVPEHVESRSLTVPRRPGVEQGRLHMWLDLFPETGHPPNPRVNIAPRTPSAYELRVIVWNAEEIPLDDTNLLGEKMSDIFFKCWLGEKKNKQSTDIHYRSLTGEGQFNWRMVFPFRYWPMTGRMVTKKEVIAGMFTRGEQKIPCILTVQAWDADLISANDFLSSVNLELCHMPQGAKTAKSCNLANINIRPSLNLFKVQRTRGWWPLKDDQGNMAGKVELELEIVTKEEAATRPAGKGRDPPQALPAPQRLDTNFFWLMNPGRALKYLLWRPCRKTILCVLFVTPCLLAFIALPMIWLNKVF